MSEVAVAEVTVAEERLRRFVATSDCECIRPGLVGQPANTASSLAFVAVGVPVVRRAAAERRWAWVGVGVGAVLAGVGSVGYHGPGGRAAKVLHDVGVDLLGASLVLAVAVDGSPRRVSPRTAALTAAAVALHLTSRTDGPLCAPESPLQGHAVFHVVASAAVASAVNDQMG